MGKATRSDIEFAEAQISEARRRLDSVEDRITERSNAGDLLAFIRKPDSELIIPESDEHFEELRADDDHDLVNIGQTTTVKKEFEDHIQNIIIDCQLSIEISVKSMFKLIGVEHPHSHGLSLKDKKTRGFLELMSSEHDMHEEAVRAIFLTKFWSEFYELAKYGSPDLNIRPELVFTDKEAKRAINDTRDCVSMAETLLDSVKH